MGGNCPRPFRVEGVWPGRWNCGAATMRPVPFSVIRFLPPRKLRAVLRPPLDVDGNQLFAGASPWISARRPKYSLGSSDPSCDRPSKLARKPKRRNEPQWYDSTKGVSVPPLPPQPTPGYQIRFASQAKANSE